MEVSPPAVTEMIKKLISEDLIVKDKHKGYLLTETGTINVAELYRKHRLIEVFLVDHLQYSCDQIHQEAEILEHTVSDHFIDALDRLLNYPQTCPHGGQIPKSGQLIEEFYNQTFTQGLAPGNYVLRRVQDQHDLLHYLETVGLKIGTPFTLEGFDPFTQLYRLHIDGKDVQIPEAIASNLYIESN
jgi:DtxR family transcriptional regulator, Mn-dependent transcriptional regulator